MADKEQIYSTCAISIIRIFSLSKRTQSKDIFWTSVATACWSIVELHCGIICSCLATLRPLLRILFPFLKGATTSTGRGGQPISYQLQPHSTVKHSNAKDDGSKGDLVKVRTGPIGSSTEALRDDTTIEEQQLGDGATQTMHDKGKNGNDSGSEKLDERW